MATIHSLMREAQRQYALAEPMVRLLNSSSAFREILRNQQQMLKMTEDYRRFARSIFGNDVVFGAPEPAPASSTTTAPAPPPPSPAPAAQPQQDAAQEMSQTAWAALCRLVVTKPNLTKQQKNFALAYTIMMIMVAWWALGQRYPVLDDEAQSMSAYVGIGAALYWVFK
jgi:hypothetical protein